MARYLGQGVGGGDSWLCCSRSAVLVRAESGKPGKRDGEQGAPLQGSNCGGDLGGGEQSVGLRPKPSSCSLCPSPSQVIHVHVGPTGMEEWEKQCRGCQLIHPLPAPTCRRLCSRSWLESGWSCRAGGCQLSKARIAPSTEGGVRVGLAGKPWLRGQLLGDKLRNPWGPPWPLPTNSWKTECLPGLASGMKVQGKE